MVLIAITGLSIAACGGRADEEDGGGGGSGSGSSGGSGALGTGGDTTVYENGSFSGCTDPADFVPGVDTGVYSCMEPLIWRKEAIECPNRIPQDNVVEFPQVVLDNLGGAPGTTDYEIVADECSSSADCDEKSRCVVRQVNVYGECIQPEPYPIQWARECVTGCTEDTDCGADQLCLCGVEIGQCASVSTVHGCASDDDCSEGSHCLYNLNGSFGCQLPGDECDSGLDCDPGEECYFVSQSDARVCADFSGGC